MATNKSASERWVRITAAVSKEAPQFSVYVTTSEDFRSVLFKLKPDGTVLGVLKGHLADGSPSVCFGVGYDLFGAIMGLEATLSSGDWRKDNPWPPTEK